MPLHEHNIGLAERVFALFIQEQRETRKAGDIRHPSVFPVSGEVRSWCLDFSDVGGGKATPINLMIITDDDPTNLVSRITLEGFIEREASQLGFDQPELLFSVLIMPGPGQITNQ